MENALILAGAVAKGAFEAGVLEVLARRGVAFRRIVSTSAGALNATVFSAGARVGRTVEVAASLVELWSDYARWSHVFSANVAGFFGARGISGPDKVRTLLQDQLSRWLDDPAAPPPAERVPIDLRLVVALLNGTVEPLGPGRATTFERVLAFDGAALDDRGGRREQVIDAALASAAFPVVFLPVDLGPGLGPALDGGAVDNAPIREAVHNSDIRRVYVVSTDPAELPPLSEPHGEALITRLIEILIGERLFRDLQEAYQTNAALAALDRMVAESRLSPTQLAQVLEAIGWTGLRPLEIVPIRPGQPLSGSPFSGFFSHDTRAEYVRLGREAAELALGG